MEEADGGERDERGNGNGRRQYKKREGEADSTASIPANPQHTACTVSASNTSKLVVPLPCVE